MRLLLPFALLAVLACGAPADNAAPPPDPDLGTDIVAGAAMDGSLFLLGEGSDRSRAGTLVSFRLSDGARTIQLRNVIAIHKAGEHLWAFAKTAQPQLYRLMEWRNGAFAGVSTIAFGWRNTPLALTDIAGHPAVLGTRSVRRFDGAAWQNVGFDDDTSNPTWGYASVGAPAAGRYLYIGFNRGEWGGGLKRVDLASGKVEVIENHAHAAGSMSSVLESDLDPVQAIIPDPARNDCVLIAIGLVHMMASGRVDRVCGLEASIVFDPVKINQYPGGNLADEQAFFGLIATGNGYWAASDEGVYHFGPPWEPGPVPEPEKFPFGKFEFWHGLWVTRGVPGAIVLVTEINRHFSVNGGTPLIVPLD
ncbi:MAG TPA: hypothetical protein VNU97_14195 [Rhizomicrobium sp.]|nr:hypothetical protein [Rhizomicrobium sp.]